MLPPSCSIPHKEEATLAFACIRQQLPWELLAALQPRYRPAGRRRHLLPEDQAATPDRRADARRFIWHLDHPRTHRPHRRAVRPVEKLQHPPLRHPRHRPSAGPEDPPRPGTAPPLTGGQSVPGGEPGRSILLHLPRCRRQRGLSTDQRRPLRRHRHRPGAGDQPGDGTPPLAPIWR